MIRYANPPFFFSAFGGFFLSHVLAHVSSFLSRLSLQRNSEMHSHFSFFQHLLVHFFRTTMPQDEPVLCTAVASPQAEPLSWLTLRLATLLVLSNTNP